MSTSDEDETWSSDGEEMLQDEMMQDQEPLEKKAKTDDQGMNTRKSDL